jgi:hypothetical protein
MRKLIPAAAILLLFMGTAQAQYINNSGGNTGGNPLGMNMMPDNRRHLTPEEAQREREIESQYNQTVNEKIPDKKSSNDPWGIVRKQQK